MANWHRRLTINTVLALIGLLALLLISGCGSRSKDEHAAPGTSPIITGQTEDSVNTLPQDGKLRLPSPPEHALLGQLYINTTDNREWIHDGWQWVPHDNSVDEYYRELAAGTEQPMLSNVLRAEPITSVSGSVGAHGRHIQAGYQCIVCHRMHDFTNIVTFDLAGPAVAPGLPSPGFDTTGKSCSNIACHGLYSGTFSYFFPGGDGESELKTVSYVSNNGNTPSWYDAGLGCSGCHGNPPQTGTWHSGLHAPLIVGGNDCQLCHPDAAGSGGVGDAITDPSLHVNGTVNVVTQFTNACFGCH